MDVNFYSAENSGELKIICARVISDILEWLCNFISFVMSFNDKYFHLFDQIDIYIYILLQNRIKIGFFDRATDITTLLI